ncbi:MAG: bifunctional (p)ppGpp synthetase/guanosine-3',5'-bis(diphosphate) 3'-pyrophosphohydrolase [Actinomycetota bacterium]
MAQAKPVSRSPLRAILGRLRRTPHAGEAPEVLRPVYDRVRGAHPRTNADDIIRAYQVAAEVHEGQLRLSGDPFITHPLAVAQILADMGMDPTTIVGALLHDAVEDTDASLNDLRESFGDEVAEIIDGLTKIAKISFRSTEAAQAENYRKMMVAMARDVRVIIIKLADRLHNMRTLDPLPPEKQELKARETLEVYVPLASRLGMFQVRSELEDLAFRYLYTKRFEEIADLTDRRQPERDAYLVEVVKEIDSHLDQAKIRANVSGRAKNFYSIYQKMVERGVEFDDIFDLVGVRIVVEDLRDCYAALGVIHAMWKPLPGRFKDYIAMPKFNMYQSLHTSVMGPEGKPLEIQIRTRTMHEMAEYGISAHWKYKEADGGRKKPKSPDSDVPWLGELVETFHEAKDPREFMESLRLDLFHDEVFCFTPKGHVISLPRGACPIDFAYAIHTEVGHRTMGARVNGSLVPLDTRLDSGDVVEILTTRAQDARPKEDWLAIVKTSRASNRIRHWLTAHRREAAREEGRDLFVKTLRREGIGQNELTLDIWRKLFSELRTSGEETLYESLGEGRLPTADLVEVLRQVLRPSEAEPVIEPVAPTRRTEEAPSVVVKGERDVAAKLARCCAPVPGDEVFGFITRGRGVSVHRSDCPNAKTLMLQSERVVEVEWDTSQGGRFTVVFQVSALDRTGLLRDISDTLTDCGVMILSSSSWAKSDGTARLRFAFQLADIAHLDHIQRTVRRVEGVFDAYRVLPLKARQG